MQIESSVQVTINLPDNTKESGLQTNIFTHSHTAPIWAIFLFNKLTSVFYVSVLLLILNCCGVTSHRQVVPQKL